MPSSAEILAQVRRETTIDLIRVRSPSRYSGNFRNSISQTIAPRIESPRNSSRSFETSR